MGYSTLCYLLLGAYICYAEWNDAKFEIIQNDPGITSSHRIQYAAAHMNPEFAGVRIDQMTMIGFGLSSNWSRNASFEIGYTYMVKTFARDVYDPPVCIADKTDNFNKKTFKPQ